MPNEVIQMPFRITEFNEDMIVALDRNFKEIERLLGTLQLYMNKIGEAADKKANMVIDDNFKINADYIDGEITYLVGDIEKGQGSVTITDENGIMIVDNKENPTKALRLLGGIFALANEKNQDGSWRWRAFGTGDGFTADEINGGTIRAGVVLADGVIVGTTTLGDVAEDAEQAISSVDEHTADESPHNLPSYCKMQSDGFKVYDQYNALRCHLGQYASGEYGLRIVDGIIEANGILYDKTTYGVSAIIDGFGDGSDGVFNSTGPTLIDVETEDASSVVLQYESFTLNSGHQFLPTKRCRGVFIYCQGDVVINGTMFSRAAKVSKVNSQQRVLQIPVGVFTLEVPAGGKGGDGGKGGNGGGKLNEEPYGADGGAAGYGTDSVWFGGGFGGAGGGGGGGASWEYNWAYDGGNAGTSELDQPIGEGGLGFDRNSSPLSLAHPGGNLCGGGGGGNRYAGAYTCGDPGGGGAGVKGGGGGIFTPTVIADDGSSGLGIPGGLVCIVAKGNISIGAGGSIACNALPGGNGGDGSGDGIDSPGGGGGGQGGGGGGVIVLACRGTYTNLGSLYVQGGAGGLGGAAGTTGGYGAAEDGGDGEDGEVGKIVVAKV